MNEPLGRILFPLERERLARLHPPRAGESDQDWLTRMVADRTAVLVTRADARDPRVYRARVAQAAERYLVIVSDGDATTASPEPPPPTDIDRDRYLAERRAGKSPDEAARNATTERA